MGKISIAANEAVSPNRSCGSPDRESSPESSVAGSDSGLSSLRGVQWRIRLGVLPATASSIDELRRAAANGRRKYADLRRRLLVDPHVMEENQKAANLNMDNPLSQNPESVWGRFFRNVELERTIDKDLSRLYPEHGSYFQTPACQAMLRRILLLRALRHSEHSYRQGMHELLAPLLYVLHVDVMHLSQVKHLYEDVFDDRFEGLSFQESSLSSNEHLEKQNSASSLGKKVMRVTEDDKAWNDCAGVESQPSQTNMDKHSSTDEFDMDIRSIFLGSDAYGAEGELGALLSVRFMEHDAYCMFDALLSGQGGAVVMADYFTNSPALGSVAGLPPVIEASIDIYNLLAVVDISLYSHLVELGVEPQYFALRWLRVLYGREFVLEDLLLVWDAIFEASNNPLPSGGDDVFRNNTVHSPRSAFISAMAVSMLLHLRSALFATHNATSCLQRLLNFPCNADVKKLIHNAKSLQMFYMDTASIGTPPKGNMGWNFDNARAGKLVRSVSASSPYQIAAFSHNAGPLQHQKSGPCSSDRMRVSFPDSYWEEKWRTSVLQKVVPEESFDQQDAEGLGKGLAGEADGKCSTDVSSEQCAISNHPDMAEAMESGKENCLPILKDDSDCVSNNMDHKYEDGTSGKLVRQKLLDDLVKSMDSDSESTINGIPLINDKGVDFLSTKNVPKTPMQSPEDVTNTKHCDGNISVQSNGRHLSVLIGEQAESEGVWTEDQTMGTITHSESVKDLNIEAVLDPRSEGVSILPIDGIKQQESSLSVSDSNTFLMNDSEVARTSVCNTEGLDRAVIVEGEELPAQISIGNNGSCELNPNGDSPGNISEGSSGKSVTSNASQIGGISEVTSKQKPTSAAPFGKFHWMWNFGRRTAPEKSRISPEKANCEISTTESRKTIGSDGRRGLSKETTVCHPISGTADSSLQPALENDGDSHSCNLDVQVAKLVNCTISEPLLNNSVVSRVCKDKNPSAALRTLGQSMLENIQVIESAFSQGCTMMNKDGTQVSSREKLEHSSRNFLGGKGHVTALAALAELRKISNILSQM